MSEPLDIEPPEPSSPLSAIPSSPPLCQPPCQPPEPTTPAKRSQNALADVASSDDYQGSPRRTKEQFRAMRMAEGQGLRAATMARNRAERKARYAAASHPPIPALLSESQHWEDGNASISASPAAEHAPHEPDVEPYEPHQASPLNTPSLSLPVNGGQLHIEGKPTSLGSTQHADPTEFSPAVATASKEIFALLKHHSVTLGEFIEYVSHSKTGQGLRRWHGLFKNGHRVKRVLGYWTLSRNHGRHTVRRWAVDYVSGLVYREGSKVTQSGLLRPRNKPVDESFILDFDLPTLSQSLEALCPVTTQLMKRFSTTQRQKREANDTSEKKRKTVGYLCLPRNHGC